MSIVTSKRTITVERATEEDRKWLELGEYDYAALDCSEQSDL